MKFSACCGLMITASHNTKEYNGMKLYSSNGTQIRGPVDEHISKHIALVDCGNSMKISQLTFAKDPLQQIHQNYANYLHQLFIPSTFPLRVTFTAMHGVGFEFALSLCFSLFPRVKFHFCHFKSYLLGI